MNATKFLTNLMVMMATVITAAAQANVEPEDPEKNFYAAQVYCERMNMRIATLDELIALYRQNRLRPRSYWSSNTVPGDEDRVYFIQFSYGSFLRYSAGRPEKIEKRIVRCVPR
jgi:hypothetical protein